LPQLKVIAADLKLSASEVSSLLCALEPTIMGAGHDGSGAMASRLAHASARVQPLVERISALGCEVGNLQHGLIEFPHPRGGRMVYLCWKWGEEDIGWWHEVDAGYAGRRRRHDNDTASG
jgi:hypothetical protein